MRANIAVIRDIIPQTKKKKSVEIYFLGGIVSHHSYNNLLCTHTITSTKKVNAYNHEGFKICKLTHTHATPPMTSHLLYFYTQMHTPGAYTLKHTYYHLP